MSKRILTLVVAAAFIFALVGVSTAKAATVEELTALIAQLQAQIAALTGGSTTAAGEITKDLTIGSRGDQVEILQKYLEDEGYLVMPVGVAYGYFGNLTKAAVAKWQADNGVAPAYGYFGPKSRAMYATLNPVTPVDEDDDADEVATELGDTDGSATVTLSTYVANQTLKKGETKDIYALKVQASTGKVAINRFDVRMSVRPWLYFNKLVLKDSNGTVIAEKAISGASDATELTVGSSYLVRFDDINYVVTPGSDKILVVSASVLPTTDKLVSGSDVSVTVKTGSNGVRIVNGKGYSESLTEDTGRTVTLSSTGSTGNIVARANSNTPAARIVQTSTSGEINGVTLGVFDFKAENQSSTLNTLTFALNANSNQEAFGTVFKRLYIEAGGSTYNVDSVASSSVFSNLTIDLPKDEWKTVTLKADVADADDFTNGYVASSSMVVNNTNIVGIDANYTTVTATGGNTIASNNVTLLQSGASLSGLTKLVSNNPGANGVKGATSTMSFTFTVNNTGSNDIYVSKTPATFVATSTTAVTGGLTLITSGTTYSTDGTAYYVIPSGTSRQFTLSGTYGNAGAAAAGIKTFSITSVYFDDDTSGLQEFSINYGLEDWYVGDYQDK